MESNQPCKGCNKCLNDLFWLLLYRFVSTRCPMNAVKHLWWCMSVLSAVLPCKWPWPRCLHTSVTISSCLHSGHGSGMKRVIIWPLLSPLSQFDMMNVQFPLSPHSQLITISINKACPTSLVDITEQRVTSWDDLSLQWAADFSKSGLI